MAAWFLALSLPFLLHTSVVITVIYLTILTLIGLAGAIKMLIHDIARREHADLTGDRGDSF